MKILDLNGKPIKKVTETKELKDMAEKELLSILDRLNLELKKQVKRYEEFENLSEVLNIPVQEFELRIESLKDIIQVGVLESQFLGITQEEDYSELRKDLLKEMMYYIETHKN